MDTAQKLPQRSELPSEFKWRLEDIYKSEAAWEEDFLKVKEMLQNVSPYKGRIGDSSKNLFEILKLQDEISCLFNKLFAYARMKRDEDNTVTLYQSLVGKAFSLGAEYNSVLSFVTPEIISIPETTITKYMDEESDLKVYNTYLKELLHKKNHVLSEKEEKILALSSELASSISDIYSMYNNADIKFPNVKGEQGQDVELTKGRYIRFMESPDREVRKKAYEALYKTYGSMKNTLASTLIGNIKKNKFYSVARNYSSSLEASLDLDNVSIDVYDNLIDIVSKNLPLLHRYLRLRKKALKLDELHMYDLYCPIVPEASRKVPYEDAVKVVSDGLSSLGEQYIKDLNKGFKSSWIDVYENVGKTSGAYSWGVYTSHPFVLLNYQGSLDDVLTLAHEMGHAMHSYYTHKTQPFVYSENKIFVAEVASTVNESLLINHLLSKTDKTQEKAWLLNNYLEAFRGTIFRQVMFAEFEKIIHQRIESGNALTAEDLCTIYKDLNEKYYGSEVTLDSYIEMEWARIPHFYRSFYVYKYATGFSSATSIAGQILRDGASAVEKYLNFLSSGSSDYPLELLKKTGVDLTTTAPIQDALNVFEKRLSELEKLLDTL
jgi:oligoendopeptidase F